MGKRSLDTHLKSSPVHWPHLSSSDKLCELRWLTLCLCWSFWELRAEGGEWIRLGPSLHSCGALINWAIDSTQRQRKVFLSNHKPGQTKLCSSACWAERHFPLSSGENGRRGSLAVGFNYMAMLLESIIRYGNAEVSFLTRFLLTPHTFKPQDVKAPGNLVGWVILCPSQAGVPFQTELDQTQMTFRSRCFQIPLSHKNHNAFSPSFLPSLPPSLLSLLYSKNIDGSLRS